MTPGALLRHLVVLELRGLRPEDLGPAWAWAFGELAPRGLERVRLSFAHSYLTDDHLFDVLTEDVIETTGATSRPLDVALCFRDNELTSSALRRLLRWARARLPALDRWALDCTHNALRGDQVDAIEAATLLLDRPGDACVMISCGHHARLGDGWWRAVAGAARLDVCRRLVWGAPSTGLSSGEAAAVLHVDVLQRTAPRLVSLDLDWRGGIPGMRVGALAPLVAARAWTSLSLAVDDVTAARGLGTAIGARLPGLTRVRLFGRALTRLPLPMQPLMGVWDLHWGGWAGHGWYHVPHRGLKRMVSPPCRLRRLRLDLRDNRLTAPRLTTLLSVIGTAPTVVDLTLDLGQNPLGPAAGTVLTRGLHSSRGGGGVATPRRFDRLVLWLDHTGLGDLAAREVLWGLWPTLATDLEVGLAWNALTLDAIASPPGGEDPPAVAGHLTVDLAYNPDFGDAGVRSLVMALMTVRRLRRPAATNLPASVGGSSVSLGLVGCGVGDAGVHALCGLLVRPHRGAWQRLTLNLNHNVVTIDGMGLLLDALAPYRRPRALRWLTLSLRENPGSGWMRRVVAFLPHPQWYAELNVLA